MKKYLLTTLDSDTLKKLWKFYENWNIDKMRNIDNVLKGFKEIGINSIDGIYIYSNLIKNSEEFGQVLSTDIFITKKGIYYYDYTTNQYKTLEENSIVYLFRVGGIDEEFLRGLKLYGKYKYNIELKGIDNIGEDLSVKRFGLYYGTINGLEKYIPDIAIPLIEKSNFKLDNRINFIKFYFKDRIIIKRSSSYGGNNIYIFDINEMKDVVNLRGTLEMLINSGIKDMFIMELIDTKDYELRMIWSNNNGQIEIPIITKKVRHENQILHNISQGNDMEEADDKDIPEGMIENFKIFASSLNVKHGGMDIILDRKGNYFFTENNKMTGIMDEEFEYEALKMWFDKIVEIYK